MKLIGHTILKINGKTVFEKKNALTKWVYTAPVEGNFQNYMQQRNILPLSQWFSGCLLFDRNMEDIQTTINISMPDSGAKVVAQAADDDGSQSGNLKRGSKDTFRVLPNGIEHSWQWTANRGNGTIGAVALTRANNGRVQIAENYTEAGMNENNYIFEALHKYADNYVDTSSGFSAQSSDPDILAATQGIGIIDWEKEIGYRIDQNYDSTENVNTIRIRAYKLATKYTHLNGRGGCVENATPLVDESYVGLLPNSRDFSYTYQGKYIFCISGQGGGNFTILKVNTEDWTASPHTFSYPTASLNMGANGTKDCYPMYYTEENGVVTEWYMFANRNRELNPLRLTVARLNLLDGTFKIYNRPIDGGYNQQLACYMMPNGDWVQPVIGALYGSLYSKADDKFYACRPAGDNAMFPNGYHGAATYGTVLLKTNGSMWLAQTYPCISTINNLDSLVTKRTGDIMQLIYRILEVEEGEEE